MTLMKPLPPRTRSSTVLEATSTQTFARVLVALDASDDANRALAEAVRFAGPTGAITGIHAYATKLHESRFRQMEGGLPERYRDEAAMLHQRRVHDDLITRGLATISDSYHDNAGRVCAAAGLPYRRLSPEGKNYRRIVEAAESGDFDLVAVGALGLGAAPADAIGSVCARVARFSPIDVLVVRKSSRAIGDGPIVVGVDGSPRSFAALKTAFDVGRRLGAATHAVAAFDPYYHYVAFNKIAGVLSNEAARLFRFKEQERLHEELIDDGLAKIYQGHLEIARSMAQREGVELTCELLEGKAFRAILGYLEHVGASLLIVGTTGIHADPYLDIGSTAENLLRAAPCHVWLGRRAYTPPAETLTGSHVSWSREAEERISRAPEFVRDMARRAILIQARKAGHTFITADIVDQLMARMMPAGMAARASAEWSAAATALLAGIRDPNVVTVVRLRATKKARRSGAATVLPEHVVPFLGDRTEVAPAWSAAALARLARVPEMVRETVRAEIEDRARERGMGEIGLDITEEAIAEARKAMCPVPLRRNNARQ